MIGLKLTSLLSRADTREGAIGLNDCYHSNAKYNLWRIACMSMMSKQAKKALAVVENRQDVQIPLDYSFKGIGSFHGKYILCT